MRKLEHTASWFPFTTPRKVSIRNAREVGDTSLDTTGFDLREWPSGCSNFDDDSEVVRRYYPDVIALLQDVTGANDVIIKGHKRYESTAELQTSAKSLMAGGCATVKAGGVAAAVHVGFERGE